MSRTTSLFICGSNQAKLPSAVIGIVDLIVLSVPLVRGLQLYFELKSNAISTFWLTAAGLFFAIHLVVNLANWYGLATERAELMLPKLVVKSFTIILSLGFTAVFYWWTNQGSGWMIHQLMTMAKLDFEAAKAVINYGGIFLVFAASLFTVAQIWFFCILYGGYRGIREIQISKTVKIVLEQVEQKLQQKNGKFSIREPVVEEVEEELEGQIGQEVEPSAAVVTII